MMPILINNTVKNLYHLMLQNDNSVCQGLRGGLGRAQSLDSIFMFSRRGDSHYIWEILLGMSLIRTPFYWYELTLIPSWKSNHLPGKMLNEITDPSSNFNSVPIEVWEWISDFTPNFTIDVITYHLVCNAEILCFPAYMPRNQLNNRCR